MKEIVPVYGQVRSPRRRPSYDLHVLPPESHLNSTRHGSPSLYKARLKVEMFAFAHPFSSLVRDFSHLQFHLPANVPKDDVRCSQSPLTLVASTASILVLVLDSPVDDGAVGKEEEVLIARGWHGQPDDIAGRSKVGF